MLVANNERDLLLTAEDFDCVRRLIHARAGISLAPHKTEMVYSRLSKRLRKLGQTRFCDYLALLQSDAAHLEWEHFTNALTTNLTAFFREDHHFPILAAHARTRRAPLRVWCCAASTGEEPYSIAITLAEAQGGNLAPESVLSTDIDTHAIATAAAGIYAHDAVRKLDPERLQRFFLKGTGERTGLVRVRPELRQAVEFRALNLLDRDWDVGGPFDAIFCRNLMIYFDKDTQRALLARFATLLRPDGLLFAGHSENFSRVTRAFRLRSQTVYERVPVVEPQARASA
ncbi:chemotaxis protein CheR [Salinisphaera dokdonensis CL-ES53]|uniref:Chemotaxis protein methyltransferase n=1 Tax=Salinisphaera dokdonensis CL-ES53 TaxID=1304272 RepID=A0ABV2AYD5_9GAMM